MEYSKQTLQALVDADAARVAETRRRYHAEASKQVLLPHAPALGRDPAVIIERARRGMSNPFSKSAPNLTEQMLIQKYAPELVGRLRAIAEGHGS